MRKQKLNKELLLKAMNKIIERPKQWNQGAYHCGTSHCFAGWAILIDRGLPDDYKFDRDEEDSWKVADDAQEALGISEEIAEALFDASNNMLDLYSLVYALIDGSLKSNEHSYNKINKARLFTMDLQLPKLKLEKAK